MQTIPCYIVPFLNPRNRWECSGLWTVCQEDGWQIISSSNRRGKWFSPLLIRRVEPCSSWGVLVPPSMSQLAATLKKADQKLPFCTYRTSWSYKILFRLQTQRGPSTHILSSRLDYCNCFFVDLNQDSFREAQHPGHHRRAFMGTLNTLHQLYLLFTNSQWSFVLILNILVLTFRVIQAL